MPPKKSKTAPKKTKASPQKKAGAKKPAIAVEKPLTALQQQRIENLQGRPLEQLTGASVKVEPPLIPPANSTQALASLTKPATLVGPDQSTTLAVQELGAKVQLVTITDGPSNTTAMEMLTQLKALTSRLDAERLKLTKPIKAEAKRIESLFNPLSLKLEAYDKHLRTKVLEYRIKQDAAAKQEQAKLLQQATAAQESGDHGTALALAEQSTQVETLATTQVLETGSVQLKKLWDFEVKDLGKVPEEYKTLDDTKVRAAIRAGMRDELAEDGVTVTRSAIPGLRIFQRDSLAVGAA